MLFDAIDNLAMAALQPGTSNVPSTIPLWAAVVGLLGAIAGAVLTGWMSCHNQVAADKRRWSQEERVQRQRWDREDILRYHQERLQAYKGLLEKTDPTNYRRTFLMLKLLARTPEQDSGTVSDVDELDTADNGYGSDAANHAVLLEVLRNQPETEMIAYRSEIELLAPAKEVQDTAKQSAQEALSYGNDVFLAALDPTSRQELSEESLEELNIRRGAFLAAARRDLGVSPLMD